MDTLNNEDYLKGIAENNLRVLQNIYNNSLPEVIKHIKKNSGTTEDAKDVFQEGILVVFKKVSQGELELTTPFHVYLFSICKRIWLKKLKKRGQREVTFDSIGEYTIEEDLDEAFIKTRKWNLFNNKFQALTEECRTVLKMLFNGKSGKEIAQAMGYTEEYAKRKKYKCKNSLAEMIKKDPEYKDLKL